MDIQHRGKMTLGENPSDLRRKDEWSDKPPPHESFLLCALGMQMQMQRMTE
jgi:hypothetical protein